VKVAIIGPGSIGKALAKRLALAGHDIRLSFSRDEQRLRATAAGLGVGFGAPDEVARWADVIALATPWPALRTAMDALGDVSGKVIWDNTNAVASDLSTMLVGTTTSVGEEVQKHAPRAHVVKARHRIAVETRIPRRRPRPCSRIEHRGRDMLKRPLAKMPAPLRTELEAANLMPAFKLRPPYQRNDYLHWIARANHPETRRKRIDQMIDELTKGGVYMGMPHRPSRR
jgi:hypothetical protein